jgi:hypothetical protein
MLTPHCLLVLWSRRVELNIHSPIRLHGVVLNYAQGQLYSMFPSADVKVWCPSCDDVDSRSGSRQDGADVSVHVTAAYIVHSDLVRVLGVAVLHCHLRLRDWNWRGMMMMMMMLAGSC